MFDGKNHKLNRRDLLLGASGLAASSLILPNAEANVNTSPPFHQSRKGWIPIATGPSARNQSKSVYFPTYKRFFVYGGSTGINTGAAYWYDPALNSWTTLTSGTTRRSCPIATNGTNIFAFGGVGPVNSSSWYTPSSATTGTWTTGPTAAPCPSAREYSTCVALANGKYVVFGGRTASGGTYYADGAVMDTTANSGAGGWTALPAPSGFTISPRAFHAACAIGNKMYIWGGETTAGGVLGDGFVYDNIANSWSQLPAPPAILSARLGIGSASDGSEWFVFGGGSPAGAVYNIASNTWRESAISAQCPAAMGFTDVHWTGEKYLAWIDTGCAAIYDPVADSWAQIPTGNGPVSGYGQFASTYGGGYHFVFGGTNGTRTNKGYLLYRPEFM